MKWINLSTYKKEIPANEKLALWIPDKDSPKKGDAEFGALLRIEFMGKEKNYIFHDYNNSEIDNATHFSIIEGPKE